MADCDATHARPWWPTQRRGESRTAHQPPRAGAASLEPWCVRSATAASPDAYPIMIDVEHRRQRDRVHGACAVDGGYLSAECGDHADPAVVPDVAEATPALPPRHEPPKRRHHLPRRLLRHKVPAILELTDLDVPRYRLPLLRLLPPERELRHPPEKRAPTCPRRQRSLARYRAQPVARANGLARQRGARGPCRGRRLCAAVENHDSQPTHGRLRPCDASTGGSLPSRCLSMPLAGFLEPPAFAAEFRPSVFWSVVCASRTRPPTPPSAPAERRPAGNDCLPACAVKGLVVEVMWPRGNTGCCRVSPRALALHDWLWASHDDPC